MEFDETLAIIKCISKQFKRGSKERSALKLCCKSLLFAYDREVRDEFLDFSNKKEKLSGLDIIQLKTYGCEIPSQHKTSGVIELESEIDILAAKIEKFL
jgi:hypothetical protein